MKTSQRGVGFIGMLSMVIAIVLIAVLAMKLVPAYIEYFTFKKIVTDIAQSDVTTPQEIRAAFQKRADVDYVDTVSARDLAITKDDVSFAYEKRIPLFANVSIVIDFAGSSEFGAR